MDFNCSITATHGLAKLICCAKICAMALACVCLLNFGCSSEPNGDDSKANQSLASGDLKDLSSTDKKTAVRDSKKSVHNAQPSQPKPPGPDVNDTQFHSAIKTAAENYLQFAIVNTSSTEAPEAKLAPASCAPESDFILEDPAARMSQADSDSGHGRKLYFLFAKDSGHYLNPDGSDSPVGQVLVKESWTAVPANADARNLRSHASGNRVNPRVTVDGKTLKLGKRNNLFVMLKEDPKNKATDDGWVYGVIDPNSYEIKASGAVASCVGCHEREKDRLFRDGIIDWNAKAKEMSASSVNKPAKPDNSKANQ